MLCDEERGAQRVAREVHLAEHEEKISALYRVHTGRRNHHVRTVIERLLPTQCRRVESCNHSRSQLFTRVLNVLSSVARNGQHTRPTLLKQRWNLVDWTSTVGAEQQRLRRQPERHCVNGRGAESAP